MESWRQGRDELLDELTKICNRIDTNLGAELHGDKFTSISKNELISLREKSARVEFLVNGNARLVQELEQYRATSLRTEVLEEENKRPEKTPEQAEHQGHTHNVATPMEPSDARSSPVLDLTPNNLRDSARLGEEIDSTTKNKYNSLVAKFNKLHENHKELKVANSQLNAGLMKQKSLTKSWRSHADNLQKQTEEKEDTIQRQKDEILTLQARLDDRGGPLQLIGTNEGSSSISHARAAMSLTCLAEEIGCDGVTHENVRISDTQFELLEPHHSSTTQDGEASSPDEQDAGSNTTKKALSRPLRQLSSSPVVVSSRSVRKRRSTKRLEWSPTVEVKIETISSSPIGLAALRDLGYGESIDLDEIGEKMNTPKKRRRELELYRQASKLSNEAQLSSGNPSQSRHSNLDDSLPEHKITPHPSESQKTGLFLQLLSPNRIVLPRTSAPEASNKRRCLASDKAIEGLGEDGQIVSTRGEKRKGNKTDANSRLEGLLGRPSPAKPVLSSAPMNSSYSSQFLASPITPTTSGLTHEVKVDQQQEELDYPRTDERSSCMNALPPPIKGPYSNLVDRCRLPSKRAEGPLNPRPIEEEPPWNGNPDNEPLRCRSLRMLDLQDFKINPAHNQGYNYAFTDVVRNRGERRCLPGCTRPECCGGKFRALASMMADRGIALTSSQKEADEKLMEEFLGDNAYKLRNMGNDEKQELLLQAKARELSNQYGRHRHAYERRKSPPGFWNADFPTTQEQMEDREKARELERELVAKRYEEAMRPGGAYIFRDE